MMSRLKSAGRTSVIFSLAVAVTSAQPALAAQDYREPYFQETQRAAFAGAVVRLDMRRGAKPATARLQMGLRSLSRGPQPEAGLGVAHVPVIELGAAGKERGSLFIAGQPTRALERKLALNGDTGTTVAVVFSVALLAVGLLVITNLNGLDDDDND